jgi:DNA-binding NarL/FixJ family response regulator
VSAVMQKPTEVRHSTSASSRPRVLLADDHSVMAEALRSLLYDYCEIIGIVADGRELVAEAAELKPDLIVADIGMPLLNGMDAAEQIKQTLPRMRFVFLTMIDDPNLAAAALRLGPVGYVLKHSAASELRTAIDEVMHGRSFITPRLRPENWAVQKERAQQASKELTLRQRDVLQLLAEGRPMKEIADLLRVSEKTVEFHKYQIMKSYNLRNNSDLVLYALKNGLISSQWLSRKE